MAEEITGDVSNPQVQLVVDEREMRTAFANGYRIYTTGEEVVVDFGFNMLNPNPQSGQSQMLFKAGDRVILSYPTVKRLSLSLGQLIRRYEEQFGQIPIQPGQPGGQAPSHPGGQAPVQPPPPPSRRQESAPRRS